MPRWLPKILKRIQELALAGRVRLTCKAAREALLCGLSPPDVRDVIVALRSRDSFGRMTSEGTGEWMYLFKPHVGGQSLYVKLVVREGCVVVSFHEDAGAAHEEEDD